MTALNGRKPRIGILGIMQDLYDDMIPGIAQRQEGYAAELAAHLSDVAEFTPSKAIKYREDAERAMREFEDADLDGVLVVMLTYGPAMRVARLLSESRLPVCLANIQPEPSVTPAWDMADMTYNQGVHGAQDTANAMVRAGKRFAVLTDDWKSASFRADVGRWARAAATAAAWKRLKVAIFGYAMNEMGDIRVDENALVRTLGPAIISVAQGDLWRGMQDASDEAVASVISFEDKNFEIDPRLSAAGADGPRPDAGGDRADPPATGVRRLHRALRRDRRRRPVRPAAAGRSVVADGQGLRVRGRRRRAHRLPGRRRARADRRRALHRDVRDGLPLGLDPAEPHGRGQLEDRPVRPAGEADQAAAGHRAAGRPAHVLVPVPAGPATLAALVSLEGDRFRLVVAEGENLDSQELPALEMPYGQFRPASGLRKCLNGWLSHGGPHHEVMNLGHHAADWKAFCQLTGIEFVQV